LLTSTPRFECNKDSGASKLAVHLISLPVKIRGHDPEKLLSLTLFKLFINVLFHKTVGTPLVQLIACVASDTVVFIMSIVAVGFEEIIPVHILGHPCRTEYFVVNVMPGSIIKDEPGENLISTKYKFTS